MKRIISNLNFDWWDGLSKTEQEKYIEENPKTKYKKYKKSSDKKADGKPDKVEKTEFDKTGDIQDFNYNEQIQKEVEQQSEENFQEKMDELEKEIEKDIEKELKGKTKLSQIIKDFHEDQKAFFKKGGYKENSSERRQLGKLIADKSKGIVHALKHEVKEYKTAVNAVRKVARGEKLDHHDKAALKSVAVHTALVVVPMAATGGMSAGLTQALPHLIGGMLEHGLVMSAGKSIVYAKKEKLDEMSDDELLEQMVKFMAKGAMSAPIKTKDWAKAVMKHNRMQKQQKAALIKVLEG